MNIIPTRDWFYTSTQEPRGYIDAHRLQELWFHTGTACNLACPFCLEGSKPGDDRLGRVKLEDLQPYMDEAVDLGVEQFSFTGGEPFVVKDIARILRYAAELKPCLVLTNGTEPVLQRKSAIASLRDAKHPICFRVSIDYLDPARHDAGRGQGNFDLALQGLAMLSELGFQVSIARQAEAGEDTHEVDRLYRQLASQYGIANDIGIVAFPDFQTPFSTSDTPEITQNCMTSYQTEAQRRAYMCAFSKMLVKQDGIMKIYSCTLVDDDPRYGFTGSLREAMTQRTILAHHRCFSCFSLGASCSEL